MIVRQGLLDAPTLVFLGSTVASIKEFPFTFVEQRGEPMIVLDKTDGALQLSAKFFSKDGTAICDIVRNRFVLNDDNVLWADESPHRLVVRDKEARTALDVEYINDRAIRILGRFFLRNGVLVTVTQEEILLQSRKPGWGLVKPTVFRSSLGKGSPAIAIDIKDDPNANPEYRFGDLVSRIHMFRVLPPLP